VSKKPIFNVVSDCSKNGVRLFRSVFREGRAAALAEQQAMEYGQGVPTWIEDCIEIEDEA
jgi:hypothetical protein